MFLPLSVRAELVMFVTFETNVGHAMLYMTWASIERWICRLTRLPAMLGAVVLFFVCGHVNGLVERRSSHLLHGIDV